MLTDIITPPPLQPGDRLLVIAPSGALNEKETFAKGLEIWRSRGYQVELSEQYHAQDGYLAGSDQQRRQALAEAWSHPDYHGILCARGGYGATRLLETWQWPQTAAPKWLIGFSDITALLWSLASHGMVGLHGPVVTTMAAEPPWSLDRLLDGLEGRPFVSLEGMGWGGGMVQGRLLPGNLTVATHLLNTPHQPVLTGAILAFEDVGEAPYRIDRLFTQWRMTGALAGVAGIALGRFSQCQPPTGSVHWPIEQVLRDRLGDLGIPIVSGLPFGHDGPNAALPVGHVVTLDGDRGLLRWHEAAAPG